MFTLANLKALGERAIVVFASTLAGLLSAGAFGLLDAPWEQSLSTAGMAALVAVLLSVGGQATTSSEGPTFTSRETELDVTAPKH